VAALLVEVMRADGQYTAAEREALERALETLGVAPDGDVAGLIGVAERAADSAVDLYRFTRLLADRWGREHRLELLALLWDVALADGERHREEEHLIRRVSELIGLTHADFIEARRAALARHANV
jgi:uncharacterized tellurite resistance protein B-like protein